MSATVFSLPAALILLIHLHLLQYPHANKPEYDHNIFNARVRSLRDRTRTMEDVCHFLIGRIEGTKDRVRKVISTYPCVQPADSTAFRTSLAKFLQDLRHSSVFPAGPSGQHGQPSGKTIPPPAEAKTVAWWWKDVVVRKSLLEECAGEKFERLILALSTYALLKGSAIHPESYETQALLRTQPRVYGTRLATFQACHHSWARAASILNKRQQDFRFLRATVQAQSGSASKYTSLSTEKLVALADSKLRDVRHAAQWSGPNGPSALKFLAEMVQLGQPNLSSSTQSAPPTDKFAAATPPSSLPIAAAHHPTTLRNLSKKIFPKDVDVAAHAHTPQTTVVASRPHASIVLAARVDAENRMLQALTDSFARTRKSANELKARLTRWGAAQRQNPAHGKHTRKHARSVVDVNLNLWQDKNRQLSLVNFEATSSLDCALGPSLSGSCPVSGKGKSLHERIDATRDSLLPKYPLVPGSASQPATARLPEPKSRPSPPQTPRAARQQLGAVIAPETVKPARYALNHRIGTADSEFERTGAATPRALQKSSPRGAISSMRGYLTQQDSDDDFDAFDEGPSMSVRDLLLQADTTHFDIIGDDSSELDNQSFGWA
ncbi:hypothetical protein MSAN_00753700 [Mycena sanguinolenta]|uniref:HAUS augmin-like complex subunit 6 N-terminal domain-containing protein n=1 Tax=Mycena sanguinolenta TaxID=230812 RepID=A0A8H6Z5P3_9AGAR|nr:hypothetical protein MSAN_00753700 [Mycena sanguinolenta]